MWEGTYEHVLGAHAVGRFLPPLIRFGGVVVNEGLRDGRPAISNVRNVYDDLFLIFQLPDNRHLHVGRVSNAELGAGSFPFVKLPKWPPAWRGYRLTNLLRP